MFSRRTTLFHFGIAFMRNSSPSFLSIPFFFTSKSSTSTNSPGTHTLSLVSAAFGKGKHDDLTHDFFKTQRAGEDACFVSRHSVGVADGVGGWADYGVDSGEISRSLMANAKRLADSGLIEPLEILSKAFDAVVQSKEVKAGSTTACIASIMPNDEEKLGQQTATLKVANLGDSGVLVVRDGAMIYRTTEQQLQFNTPYQLSILPPECNPREYIVCTPQQADIYELSVRKGDLIVVGSDGLFDNLFDRDVIEVVTEWSKEHGGNAFLDEGKRNELAKRLVDAARNAGRNQVRDSPFAQNARSWGFSFFGGKWDDVVVVVSFVVPVVQSKL